jgi:Flp pilus assembly protein TadG
MHSIRIDGIRPKEGGQEWDMVGLGTNWAVRRASAVAVARQTLGYWTRNQSGAVATVFAIFCTALFILMGLATDIGRWVQTRSQTISAMDAAVLAGGRALQLGADRQRAVTLAGAFYRQNIADRPEVLSDTVSFDVADDGLAFAAGGNVTLATPFLALANFDSLDVLQRRDLEQSKVQVGVGRFARQNLEIALMLDVSAGMSGEKIESLKQAASDFVDVVVWDDQSAFRSRVSVVPVSTAVRPPASTLEGVRGQRPSIISGPSPYGYGSAFYRLTDCAVERPGSVALSDEGPADGANLGAAYTPFGLCGMAEGTEALPLSNQRQQVLDKISGLEAAGTLAGHLGVAWSWYTLSPNWNSVWSDEGASAVAYSDTETRKIAILMSGSDFDTQYDETGLSAAAAQAMNGSSDQQTRSLCHNMKQSGIEIFTIGYGLAEGAALQSTLADCASGSDQAFFPMSATELRQAYRNIAVRAVDLYLIN